MKSTVPSPGALMPAGPARVAAVGVDPSLTHTGVCVLLDGHVAREYALETSPTDGPRPLRLVTQQGRLLKIVVSAREAAQTLVVAMEAEIWMGNAHTAGEQAAIQAAYHMMLWELGDLHFLPVNVSQVKKFAGASTKDQMLLSVYKKFGREYTDHNLADAYVIALIGYAFYCRDGYSVLTKPQRDVIAALVKAGGYPWEQVRRENTHNPPR